MHQLKPFNQYILCKNEQLDDIPLAVAIPVRNWHVSSGILLMMKVHKLYTKLTQIGSFLMEFGRDLLQFASNLTVPALHNSLPDWDGESKCDTNWFKW